MQEEQKLMRDVMRHMLFRQKAMPDVPVPRNDLTKLILASYKDTKKANMGNAVIALAQESFPKTMGMEMKELRVAPISKGKSKPAGEVMLYFMPLAICIVMHSRTKQMAQVVDLVAAAICNASTLVAIIAYGAGY